MAKYDAAQWFSNFFLSRRTLKEFLIPSRTGVNVKFFETKCCVRGLAHCNCKIFVTTTTPLVFLDFTDFTGYDAMVFYTLQSLLGISSFKFSVSLH